MQKFIWLDLVRGLAALVVCAGHLRAALIVDYSRLETASVLQKLFYAVTGTGHQAVMVFFVLSGFFVGGSVLRNADRFSPGSYAMARLFRLWVVLLPALLLTAFVDGMLAMVAPDVLTGGFKAVWSSGPVSAATYSASWSTFLANLLFLQTIATPVFGTNGPLWSLANEFWYYVLFPLCAIAVGRVLPEGSGSLATRLMSGALALWILWLLPREIVMSYPIWLLGLFVCLFAGRLSPAACRLTLAAGILAFAAALAYSKSTSLQAQWHLPADAAVGAGFCLLCIALANLPSSGKLPSAFVRLSHGTAAFSYSLYLVHFPLVAAIGAVVYRGERLAPDAMGMVHFFGWLVLLIAGGAAFWWLFERRTEEIRHWVLRLLKGQPSPRSS